MHSSIGKKSPRQPAGWCGVEGCLGGSGGVNDYRCPLTGSKMRDPVTAADGHTYERVAIENWLASSGKSPVTGKPLPHRALVPNLLVR